MGETYYQRMLEGVDWKKVNWGRILESIDWKRVPEDYSFDEAPASRVKLAASFANLSSFNAFRARDIEQIVALLILRGSINPDNLGGEILDFGTGTGCGAYVLQQYGGNVVGVDLSESLIEIAVNEGTLARDKAVVADGFQYLAGLNAESLDFISAFMMHREFPHARLYQEARRALKPGGQLLVTGGHLELRAELQSALGEYGRVEDVITVHPDGKSYGSCAFSFTKR